MPYEPGAEWQVLETGIKSKKDAERKAAWQRRGGWPTKIEKRSDGWALLYRDRDRSND